jgi:hypothetical protein
MMVGSYIVGHYRLEVANDVFNNMVHALVLSSCHAAYGPRYDTVLSGRLTL